MRPAITYRKFWPISSSAGRRRLRLVWPVPLILLYVIGGAIQYVGWLSPTSCNIVVLSIFCVLLRYRGFWRAAKYEVPVLLLTGYFIVSGFMRGTSPLSTSVYLYYSLCLLLAAPAGRLLARELITHNRVKATKRILLGCLALQLPITALQHQYADELAANAAFGVGAIDAVFGTFQINSDSVLGACCVMALLIYSYTSRKLSHILTIACLAGVVIFLGHSKGMQGIYVLLILPILCENLYRQTELKKYRRILLLLASISTIVILVINSGLIWWYFNHLGSVAASDYATRNDWTTAARLAPWGELLQSDFVHLFFGHGALTYYDPVTKHWLYNAGFSTIYSLSIDFGLLGLVGYLMYQTNVIFSISTHKMFGVFLCAIWLAFISFNDLLSNVALIFALNFTLSFVAHYHRNAHQQVAITG